MSPTKLYAVKTRIYQMKMGIKQLSTRPHMWGLLFLLLLLPIPPNFNPTDEEGFRELGQWLDLPANVAEADALVIMGGHAQQRLVSGIKLFQQGLAHQLWYTGSENTAQVAFNIAIKRGVPTEAFMYLPGSSTWEDTLQVAHTIEERDLHSVLIVTSWYHGRRTLCVLRHHLEAQQSESDNVQIYYQPVGYEDYGPDNWWLSENGRKVVPSELLKFGYYWLHHGLIVQGC